ncbi:MAG: DUF4126 domain-containing protein [Acidimicrobiales bacterium]|nr:DUF4126 domain-containing protein [Acidimicrobiales bacterium]
MPFGLIAASGWASGLNLYGTALLLGLAGRLGWAETPSQLQETWLLVALGALYVLEFVVDKVPWADSAWDAVHTVIRPIGGGLLGALLASDAGSSEAVAALLAGSFSLTAHSAKASTRAMVNTSPEPVSNVVLSIGEDGVVAGLVALALAYPVVAGAIAVVLALGSAVVAVVAFRAIRALARRWRRRRSGVAAGGAP